MVLLHPAGTLRRNRSFPGSHLNPPSSTGNRPSESREHSGSPLRQAGQAQAGDIEFENFRCQIVSQVAKSGDGQLGVDGKHATEFGACLVKVARWALAATPVVVSINCPVMRTRLPALRTLPSST